MKRVAMVFAGEWGMARRSEGYYYEFEDMLFQAIDGATRHNSSGQEREKVAEVQRFGSSSEALEWLNGEGAIIYTTRGMEWEAETAAKKHPRLRVILITGLIPGGKVVYVQKDWALSEEVLTSIALQ